MRVKEKNEKAGLKLNIQKGNGIWSHHFTANKKEKVKTVTNFIFLGSKITADGDCNHEIKRCLPLGRKAMTNLDSILKRQGHHFADKGLPSKSYGFHSSHVQV